jgi:hypothetical protein
MKDASPYDTEEALIESLEGKFTGNDKTKTGGAFHKIIEDPSACKLDKDARVIVDDFVFTQDQFMVAVSYRKQHPVMIHEVDAYKIYNVNGFGEIMVTGRVDGIEGREIRDAKTKYRQPDFGEYIDSIQWKFYLDMLKLDVFYYDIFEVKSFKELPAQTPYYIPDARFVYHEPLRCARYINLENDCMKVLEGFLEYIENRNFFHLLKEARSYEDSFL